MKAAPFASPDRDRVGIVARSPGSRDCRESPRFGLPGIGPARRGGSRCRTCRDVAEFRLFATLIVAGDPAGARIA